MNSTPQVFESSFAALVRRPQKYTNEEEKAKKKASTQKRSTRRRPRVLKNAIKRNLLFRLSTPQGRRARAQKQLTHQPRGIPPRGDNDGTRDESSFDDAVWGVDDDERIDLQHKSHEEAIILAEKKTHFREKPGASGNRRNLPGAARIVQMRDSSAHWARGFREANVPMGGHDVHRRRFGDVREANGNFGDK